MFQAFYTRLNVTLTALCLAFLLSAWTLPALAQSVLPLPVDGAYGGILEENRIAQIAEDSQGQTNFLQSVIYGVFSNDNVRAANIIFGSMAIVYLIVVGVKFILSQGNEEEIKTAQKHFAYIILGLMIVSVAQVAGFLIFNPDQTVNPDYFVNNDVHDVFYSKAMQVKLYIQIAIGGIALLSILTSAFRIIASTGNEEVINKERQLLKNFFFATILILLAEVVVKGVFYLPGANREGVTNQAVSIAVEEIMGLLTAILSIVGAAALIMLVLSGLYYVVSFGEEERANRAKRLFFNVLIAVVVIFSAYTILRFFITP